MDIKHSTYDGSFRGVTKKEQAKQEKKETPEQAAERRSNVTFVPRKSDVLMDIIEIQPKSFKSGIVLPEGTETGQITLANFDDHPFQGVVVALGPDFGKTPIGASSEITTNDIKVGDRVAFRPQTSISINDKGHVYLLFSDRDIIGILEKTGGV
jgi:co-chaperonin GroES (HSP10)